MADATIQLLLSIGIAVLYGLAKYREKRGEQPFRPKYLAKTILISVIVGLVSYRLNLTYEQSMEWLSSNAALMWFMDEVINSAFKLRRKPPTPLTFK